MKYCEYCGEELLDGIKFCPNCGAKVEEEKLFKNIEPEKKSTETKKGPSSIAQFNFILMIITIVATAFTGVGLLCLFWMIPMTASYRNKTKNHENVSVGFKICTIIFFSLISGILMFCDEDYN